MKQYRCTPRFKGVENRPPGGTIPQTNGSTKTLLSHTLVLDQNRVRTQRSCIPWVAFLHCLISVVRTFFGSWCRSFPTKLTKIIRSDSSSLWNQVRISEAEPGWRNVGWGDCNIIAVYGLRSISSFSYLLISGNSSDLQPVTCLQKSQEILSNTNRWSFPPLRFHEDCFSSHRTSCRPNASRLSLVAFKAQCHRIRSTPP